MYKEDFSEFTENLNKATEFIVNEKGDEVISERHQKDYHKPEEEANGADVENKTTESFTDISFEDI